MTDHRSTSAWGFMELLAQDNVRQLFFLVAQNEVLTSVCSSRSVHSDRLLHCKLNGMSQKFVTYPFKTFAFAISQCERILRVLSSNNCCEGLFTLNESGRENELFTLIFIAA